MNDHERIRSKGFRLLRRVCCESESPFAECEYFVLALLDELDQ